MVLTPLQERRTCPLAAGRCPQLSAPLRIVSAEENLLFKHMHPSKAASPDASQHGGFETILKAHLCPELHGALAEFFSLSHSSTPPKAQSCFLPFLLHMWIPTVLPNKYPHANPQISTCFPGNSVTPATQPKIAELLPKFTLPQPFLPCSSAPITTYNHRFTCLLSFLPPERNLHKDRNLFCFVLSLPRTVSGTVIIRSEFAEGMSE